MRSILLAGGLVVALMQLGSSAGLSADRVTESPAWLDGLRVVWSSLCSAASTVVPEPIKQSSTSPPGGHDAEMMRSSSATGFCVG